MIRRLYAAAAATALALAPAVAAPAAPPSLSMVDPPPYIQPFPSSQAEQQWVVPAGVSAIHVLVQGAPGAAAPDGVSYYGGGAGHGAKIEVDVDVTPGETLFINVGGYATVSSGGWNGGADGRSGADSATYGRSGGGGGATDLRTVSCGSDPVVCAAGGTLASRQSRLVVAGGGGSTSYGPHTSGGGAGGGGGGSADGQWGNVADMNGTDGADASGSAGGGGGGQPGTANAAGPAGADSQLGTAPPGAAQSGAGATGGVGGQGSGNAGGGGGGGWYGGGGGAAGSYSGNFEGGGGGGGAGSSWLDPARTHGSVVGVNTSGTAVLVIFYDPVPDPTTGPGTPAELTLKVGGRTVPVDAQGRTPVTAGQEFTVEGTGLLPGSTVTVEVRSAPVLLAKPTVAPNGAFATVVTLPAGLADGVHTLVATGLDSDGDPVVAEIPLVVGGLPVTGDPVGPMITVGLVALLLGAAAVLLARRRRPANRV